MNELCSTDDDIDIQNKLIVSAICISVVITISLLTGIVYIILILTKLF